ncbi:unnamed protein product [Pleuronectes platessa]|uniref:Uncharacterized protein n=1 Tax=Pleuronectes platessa TaxID=8262 RepID=A0A9N7V873_PLEPL|nr:unnamed protein product [Pleuronectes platessa]
MDGLPPVARNSTRHLLQVSQCTVTTPSSSMGDPEGVPRPANTFNPCSEFWVHPGVPPPSPVGACPRRLGTEGGLEKSGGTRMASGCTSAPGERALEPQGPFSSPDEDPPLLMMGKCFLASSRRVC